jgi:hypothetical protein
MASKREMYCKLQELQMYLRRLFKRTVEFNETRTEAESAAVRKLNSNFTKYTARGNKRYITLFLSFLLRFNAQLQNL